MSRQQKSNSSKKPLLQKANEVKRSMSGAALQASDIVFSSDQNRELKELRPSTKENSSVSNDNTPELAENAAVMNNILQQSSEEQEKRRHAEEQLSIKTIRITELETENQRLHAEANQWHVQSARINDYQITVNEQRERINQLTNQSNEVQCQNRHLMDEKTLLQQNIDSLTQRIRELEINSQLSRQRSFNGQTPDWILNREEIIVSEQGLGVGGWGSVKTGKFRGLSVAVKQIHELILSPHNRELFEREMTIASQCRHPCLLQFIGATNDNDSPLFVTEMLETDLRTLMSQRPLEENETLKLCHDIACALNYLHMMHPVPIIHRDLSSSNILLWHEGSRLRAKISDYGAANFMMDSMTQNPGAVLYSAPEAGTPQQSTKVGK